MLSAIVITFIIFSIVYFFTSGAVLYHLYHYTMPGWTASKIVIPVFLAASFVFFVVAFYFFFNIPWEQLP